MAAIYGRRDGGGAQELLDLALRREYGMEKAPETARRTGGKPWFPSCPHIYFNISHSERLVLCAVGEVPLGVDIQTVRPRREGLPRYVCSEREYGWFQARGRRWEDFCTLWTMKEARCKYTGRGLDIPARMLEVPLLEPGETGVLDGMVFRVYGGTDWRAALCAASPCVPPGRICWTPPEKESESSDFLKNKLRF